MILPSESDDSTADPTERSVLGALLLYADAVREVDSLREDDFAAPRHRMILRAIRETHADSGQTDPLSVKEVLHRQGRLVDAGGYDYLLDLVESVVTAAGITGHAAILRQRGLSRRTAELAARIAEAAAHGDDVADAVAALGEMTASGGARRRVAEVVGLAEVEALPAPAWLVDGLLPANSIGMLVAEPNLGKTTMAAALAMSVAHESPWCGRAVRGGGVLYVTGEGRVGVGRRTRAWRAWSGAVRQVHPFDVAHGLPPLSSSQGRSELRGMIDDSRARNGARPVLVVVDTLAVHWAESEDKAEFVGPCMGELRAIADAGTSILLLHHTRKPGNAERGSGGGAWAGVRGSGAWVGAADCVLSLSGTPEAISLSVTKQREAERGAPMRLRLRSVDIGDGEQAAVVALDDAAPEAVEATELEQLEADVRAVVAAVGKAGSVSPIDAIGPLANISRARGRVAVKLAVSRGAIVAEGATRDRSYAAPGGANTDTACLLGTLTPEGVRADTPTPPLPAAARMAPGLPGQFPPSGANRRESARMRESSGEQSVAGLDDGRPEQPMDRRWARRNRKVRA